MHEKETRFAKKKHGGSCQDVNYVHHQMEMTKTRTLFKVCLFPSVLHFFLHKILYQHYVDHFKICKGLDLKKKKVFCNTRTTNTSAILVNTYSEYSISM